VSEWLLSVKIRWGLVFHNQMVASESIPTVNRNATGNSKQSGNPNQSNKPSAPYPRTACEVVITFANNKTLQTVMKLRTRP
jgi:hypothetical protein